MRYYPKIRSFLWLALLLLTSCNKIELGKIKLIQELPPSGIERQKRIVGDLSGFHQLANGEYLPSRWSKNERQLSRDYLFQLLQTLELAPQQQTYISPNLNPAIDLLLGPFRGTNIYGILPSTLPIKSQEYVVLGAHYDSGKPGAPGAIDNATGIALIYNVVDHLRQQKLRNKNVIIVFFDQEEEELIGSKAFAKFLEQQVWEIHSIHCFDMVGWDSDGDFAMETFTTEKKLLDQYQQIAQTQNIPLKSILIDPVGYKEDNTDFDAFMQKGFPTIGAGECYYHRDSSPFKDSVNDTYETVNFDYLNSCTKYIQVIIEEIVSP